MEICEPSYDLLEEEEEKGGDRGRVSVKLCKLNAKQVTMEYVGFFVPVWGVS